MCTRTEAAFDQGWRDRSCTLYAVCTKGGGGELLQRRAQHARLIAHRGALPRPNPYSDQIPGQLSESVRVVEGGGGDKRWAAEIYCDS